MANMPWMLAEVGFGVTARFWAHKGKYVFAPTIYGYEENVGGMQESF
jgi:hypothetical protein